MDGSILARVSDPAPLSVDVNGFPIIKGGLSAPSIPHHFYNSYHIAKAAAPTGPGVRQPKCQNEIERKPMVPCPMDLPKRPRRPAPHKPVTIGEY